MGVVAVPPALITEFCSRGSLYDCLVAARDQQAAAALLTWHRRLSMAIDAAAGLLYLHRRSIIHRDGGRSSASFLLLLTMLQPHECLVPLPAPPCVVKSPNLLVDEAWRVKVSGGCFPSLPVYVLLLEQAALSRCLLLRPATTDFNLSKVLEGAQPESSLTSGGATNPIWQVSSLRLPREQGVNVGTSSCLCTYPQ